MTILAMTVCAFIGAEPPDAPDRVWVGPMPFVSARTLRADYFPTLIDPEKWPTVLAKAQVFKSYIMVLPDVPVPGKAKPELSDDRMRRLAAFMRTHKLKVAFEVGGLRQSSVPVQKGEWGKRCAKAELRHLRRWLDAGGTIDYLTTDHAVMMNVGSPYVQPGKMKPCGLTAREAIEELADYFQIMRKEVPTARFGVIESLGFFHVRGPDGNEYKRTVVKLPVWRFEQHIDWLLEAMKRRGLVLDHFHVDFGFMGVRHDGRQTKRPDFGRILGVEWYVQSKGVKAGLIVNAFHDRKVKDPDAKTASREAYEHTLRFFRGYIAAGGKAEHMVIQTWHPYPDKTGPESDPNTVLGIARAILTSEEFPR